MKPSPFVVTSAILAEHSNAFDELRILAKDEPQLSKESRETIRNAADELEAAQRSLVLCHAELIETRNRLIASNDQMIALRKQLVTPGLLAIPHMRMETGMMAMKLTFNNFGS